MLPSVISHHQLREQILFIKNKFILTKKFALIITLILVVCFSTTMIAPIAGAYTSSSTGLKAGISKSVTLARQDSFQNLSPVLDIHQFAQKDPHYAENLLAKIKGITHLKNRYITFFEDGSYATYEKNETTCLYYRASGRLFKVGQSIKPRGQNLYPNRDVEYDASTGKMQSVGLYLSQSESFLFDTIGNLIVHWQYQDGYDEKGQIILKRKWVKI